jgi:undecaprenyl-diphosphatase
MPVMPLIFKVLILAIVQGICELLPVSSSAHVVLTEKLLGLDPTAPAMTLLLVMLHSGTMIAVIVYFWSAWRARYFASAAVFRPFAEQVVIATLLTGVIGFGLMRFIERIVLHASARAEIEQLFGNLYVIACGLALVGVLIILSGKRGDRPAAPRPQGRMQAAWIGAVQGWCLPFRGFSRSGATISTGLLLGLDRARTEEFSFALAVVLTPALIAREGYRLFGDRTDLVLHSGNLIDTLWPSLMGMFFSFVAGLVALRWLSRWLEHGRWHLFGYYCLFAAVVTFSAGRAGA